MDMKSLRYLSGLLILGFVAAGCGSDPSGFYLNIHTAANPGGVARGQLTRVQ